MFGPARFHVYCATGYRLTPVPVAEWVAMRIAADHARYQAYVKPADEKK